MKLTPRRAAVLLLGLSIGLLPAGCAQPSAAPEPRVLVNLPPSPAPADGAPAPAAEAPVPAPKAPGSAAETPDGAPGAVALRPATAAQVEIVPPPVSLDIEGTDIQVGVIDVGIADDDEMEIPTSFYEAGWYRYGPAPGASSGNAVLAAHIDIGTEEMPFAQLKDVQLGTIITVGRESAEPVRYEVTEVRNEPKAALDTEGIFRRDGDHQLVIVTCGGDWLADRADYEDNVVLTASPL
ncbi:class F sortase [Arthrobacter agilis]|uniref:class F sortase n=1 Tax=Arthrobacter agilis TaxID=37921 RepID=UPI001E3CCB0F|nr:class F sortase [Arthrobacter agilis]